MPSRRDVLKAGLGSGLAVALGLSQLGCSDDETARAVGRLVGRRPNFLFMLADDLGWGDLGCYGNVEIQTPNLDNLASEGMRFTQYYVSSPVCSPTRAAILTGVSPGRLRIRDYIGAAELNRQRGTADFLDPAVPTLPRLLGDAGYVTGHFGKWHLGGAGAPDPGRYGFAEHATVGSSGPSYMPQGAPRSADAELIVDRATRFLREHGGTPFFLNAWFRDPHAPLDPTPEQMAPYAQWAYSGHGVDNLPTPQQVYFSTVTDLDAQIGRLLGALDELGLARNTVVIFTSDNGPEDIHLREAARSGVGNAGPFRGRKRSLYEGGIRVPFIVRWPGAVPDYREDKETVMADVDLLPTLCLLAKASVPAGVQLDGEPMVQALAGHPVLRRQHPLMWEYGFAFVGDAVHRSPALAMRDGRWKLLMKRDGSGAELYDIVADPMEVDNRASDEPQRVRRMSEALLAWVASLSR